MKNGSRWIVCCACHAPPRRARPDRAARILNLACAPMRARLDYLLGSSAGFTYVIAKGP